MKYGSFFICFFTNTQSSTVQKITKTLVQKFMISRNISLKFILYLPNIIIILIKKRGVLFPTSLKTKAPHNHSFISWIFSWKVRLGMGGARAQNNLFLKTSSPRAVPLLRARIFPIEFFEKMLFLKKWQFFNKLQSTRRVTYSSNMLSARAYINKACLKKLRASMEFLLLGRKKHV